MNEHNYMTIKISAKPYNGFQHKIKTEIFKKMSSTEIIEETKNVMKSFFKQHNLIELEQGVDKLNLHGHDDIPYNRPIIYLCDSNHGN